MRMFVSIRDLERRDPRVLSLAYISLHLRIRTCSSGRPPPAMVYNNLGADRREPRDAHRQTGVEPAGAQHGQARGAQCRDARRRAGAGQRARTQGAGMLNTGEDSSIIQGVFPNIPIYTYFRLEYTYFWVFWSKHTRAVNVNPVVFNTLGKERQKQLAARPVTRLLQHTSIRYLYLYLGAARLNSMLLPPQCHRACRHSRHHVREMI